MKYGARNVIKAKVKSVKKGDVMSLVKFDVTAPSPNGVSSYDGIRRRVAA